MFFLVAARIERAPEATAEKIDVIEKLPQAVKTLIDQDAFASGRNEILNPPEHLNRFEAAKLRNKTMETMVVFGGGIRQEVNIFAM